MHQEPDHNHKEHKIQYILISGIVILLAINSMIFISKLRSIENQVQHMTGVIAGNGFTSDLSGMEQRLFEEMKKGASILTHSSSNMEAKDGFFEVTVNVAPKEVKTEDKVFIIIDNQKVQARSINGVTYEAVLPVKSLKTIKPYVVIENGDNHLQEVLPEIYFDQFTALELSSVGIGEEDKNLRFDITAMNEETMSLLETLNDAEAVIKDENQNEVRRLPLLPLDPESPGADEYGYKKKSYEVKLPEDLYQMASFNVYVIIKGSGITLTSDEIYNFSKSAVQQGVSAIGGFSISIDE
ncbi:hypothetical protein [Proteiniclasticum sp.]|uniref:hypothetical protein n=1 Tax=Proteiniclasticum sp. TaxID=2053595 RepID=UPI002899F1CC|nr:hypothetical protein [Proteiniclasticum sp.]